MAMTTYSTFYKLKYLLNQLISVHILLLLAVFALSCQQEEEESTRQQKVKVKTAIVEHKEVTIPIRTSGKLSFKKESRLSFKTGGIISKIYVDEGQNVKRGQLLAELDLREIQAAVEQARLGLEKRERDCQRVQNLYKDSVATLEQLQDMQTTVSMAKSTLHIAEFNFQFSTIKAPASGKILKRLMGENEMISPGAPIFLFGCSESDWVVRVNLTDKDIINISLRDSAYVTFDAYPGMKFPAWVSEISNAADMNGMYEVELKIKNRLKNKLASGFICKAEIMPAKRNRFYVIPVEAIVDGSGRSAMIYQLNEKSEVKRLNVEISHILDDKLLVSDGLKTGMEIITGGAAYIRDNIEIEVANRVNDTLIARKE